MFSLKYNYICLIYFILFVKTASKPKKINKINIKNK